MEKYDWMQKLIHDKEPLSLQSIGVEKSLSVPAKIFPAHNLPPIEFNALIDCGCTAFGFIDRNIALRYNLSTKKLPRPREVYLADGKTKDQITECIIIPMTIGSHEEISFFYVTQLGPDNPLILGIPWLQLHDPLIKWPNMKLLFCSSHCHQNCLPFKSPRFVLAPKRIDRKNDPEKARTQLTNISKLTTWRKTESLDGKLSENLEKIKIPVPIPQNLLENKNIKRLDLEDIRYSSAVNFVEFCKGKDVEEMAVTWDELDQIDSLNPKDGSTTAIQIPELPDECFRNVLLGLGDSSKMRSYFPKSCHEFIDECYNPDSLKLNRISERDINKFLEGKPTLSSEEIIQRLPLWLREFSDAFLPQKAELLPPNRAWDHKIELFPGKEPPYNKNRPLSVPELKVVRRWLEDNLNKSFIRESRARCAAPLLLAAKPRGGVRVCQDYRGLNNVTIKNRYPLPLIRETLDAICHAKYFTKLDIIAAFNKLRIAEGHEWKTAFITRFGLYESLVMPFGLCNAPASFQHYINHTLHDLLDRFCTAYLDDVLVYSATRKEHREHVRLVVSRLQKAGLQIDINKCEFETSRTKYLGLIITPDGIEMDPTKVKTITSWEPLNSVKDLQKFLGFANYYRRFIRAWNWGDAQQVAFEQLKNSFTSAPTLSLFDYEKQAVLETDASDWASGGVLSQYDEKNNLRPVAYFSAKHNAAERNYEIYDKELLAIIKCLEEWRPKLQGTQLLFKILTDHKILEYFTTSKVLSQRQVRWSEFLSQFNFQIIYRPGINAVRPDALSRKREDRPKKSDYDDDRVKTRERTLLPASRFDPKILENLLHDVHYDSRDFSKEIDENSCLFRQISLVPGTECPIDDLIDRAYARNALARTMVSCLKDPECREWPKEVRKIMRVAYK
ncbi:hypothetical protein K3495_g780 [Podosphaera aphanis]|nr:hypothetical protein K3495_g780 [Podosphaera aphanis]